MHVIHPDGLNSFDMGGWQEDEGSAYLVRSVNNEYVGISPLSPDYTTTTGLVSTAPRVRRKAPMYACICQQHRAALSTCTMPQGVMYLAAWDR